MDIWTTTSSSVRGAHCAGLISLQWSAFYSTTPLLASAHSSQLTSRAGCAWQKSRTTSVGPRYTYYGTQSRTVWLSGARPSAPPPTWQSNCRVKHRHYRFGCKPIRPRPHFQSNTLARIAERSHRKHLRSTWLSQCGVRHRHRRSKSPRGQQ